jgi:hypothetical protein
MPNYVYHKLIFAVDKFPEVIDIIIRDMDVDFNLLIPQPLNMYHGSLGVEEEKDFKINWHSWNRENWGTKWNAGNTEFGIEEIDGEYKGWVKFETAWSVPYPWIAAFLNATNIPFGLFYLDEGDNFWGYESYGMHKFACFNGDRIERIEKRFKNLDDYNVISKMFRGEEIPEEDEE